MRAHEFAGRGVTSLEQLYNGNYPDRDEQFWNSVSTADLTRQLEIGRLSPIVLRSVLETQYRVDSVEDLLDLLDSDQHALLERYRADPQLSNSVIVLDAGRIIDGNHRALAAVLNGVGLRYVDLADEDAQLDEDTNNDSAFIGYLSPDGKFEAYSESAARRVDYHHSMIVRDLDAYNAEGGLTFVRYDGEPVITIKGTPAIDPYERRSAPMISRLARLLLDAGADSDMPLRVDNMGFQRTVAPYQGKRIGTVGEWAQRNAGIVETDDYSYRGHHTAPTPDYGAPLHDLRTVFSDDIYGPRAAQYHGHYGGNHPMDVETVLKIQRLRDKPRASVQIYRAVPPNVRRINPGDWVTINRSYAVEHGRGMGRYRILTRVVPAHTLWNNGDSIHEWGYHPAGDTA